MMADSSRISEWYSEQHVLITGATGFMGKILVEKLLRSCPKVGGIYAIVRPKKGKDTWERLKDFLTSPVFDKIRTQPDCKRILERLHFINGDVTKVNLNLSEQDGQLLREKVSVVFHMAASVRFDQALKAALLLNLGGTLNVLDFSCRLNNLKVFMHVSTSYCHCDETILEERLYKAPHNPRDLLDLAKWIDSEMLEELTPLLLKNSPNTYAYTKCLTEELVSQFSDRLPIVITRPSIVIAAYKEPIAGWVDNLNGPTGILIGAGKGVIRTMHVNTSYSADVVPVDMCINSMLIIGWAAGRKLRKREPEPEVYNITANRDHPLTWGEALEIGRKHVYDHPFSVCLWYPGGSPKSSYVIHSVAVLFFHLIPAYFIDFLMLLTRNQPFMVKIQKRIQNGLSVLQYYTTRPWYFHNDKVVHLYQSLNKTDQEMFYTNQEKMNMDKFMLDYILGARKYCLGEGPETLPYARKVLKRLYYADLLKNFILYALAFWFFCFFATKLYERAEDSFYSNDNNSFFSRTKSVLKINNM